jgi:arginyl-tRNA synthetase
MYFLEKIKKELVDEINRILEVEIVDSAFTIPPNAEMGDLSLPCFGLAKEKGTSPQEVIEKIIQNIAPREYLKEMKEAGPYLNFFLDPEVLARSVLNEVLENKENFGVNKNGNGEKVMIEYSNANTHKEYHIGHLRNICYGDAVNRLISANGFESIPVSYINDFGIHVAKTIWKLKKYKESEIPENKGFFLGKVYVEATRDLKENDEGKKEVGEIMKNIESRMGEDFETWQKTREWSIAGFDAIYKDLKIEFVNIFYENEFVERGMKIVDELFEKGILTKSDGAIIADLEKYDLGVLVVIRSDGTALYPVADLALAVEKFNKYDLNQSIYVVDYRQGQYFQQLEKILELSGHNFNIKHLGYDVVKLPTGAMSSREGNVITYDELHSQMMAKSIADTKSKHPDWTEEKVSETARVIAVGAMKFEMLKVGAMQSITFDINKALSFEGYTSVYLQYTFARIRSILRKSEFPISNFQFPIKSQIQNLKLNEAKERGLVMKMGKYPETIIRAKEEFDPSVLTKYLFELAQEFNDYYHAVNILKAEEDVKEARLVLIEAVSRVLVNGLGILGIEVMEEI